MGCELLAHPLDCDGAEGFAAARAEDRFDRMQSAVGSPIAHKAHLRRRTEAEYANGLEIVQREGRRRERLVRSIGGRRQQLGG